MHIKCFCLSLIFLDQSVSDKDFFHWFTLFGSSTSHKIITGKSIYIERVDGKIAQGKPIDL